MDVVCDGLPDRLCAKRTSHDEPHHGDGLSALGRDDGVFGRKSGLSLEAAVAAVCAVGLCGQTAYARLTGPEGTGAFRMYLLDAVSRLTPEELERGAQYEVQS